MHQKDIDTITNSILPLTEKYALIKAVYLAGSSVRKTNVNGSDIDVTIIVDDTRRGFDQSKSSEMNDELKKIRSEVMEKHKLELHFQPPKNLTTYWDLVRSGEPWVFTELRDALPIYDPSGFIEPLKLLLERGSISGTKEKAHALIGRAHDKIKATRKIFLDDITSELLLAMTESAQAVIMYMGIAPPGPRQIPAYLDPYINNGFLKADIVQFYIDFYNITVNIDHGVLTNLKGRDIDRYIDESLRFIRAMEHLFEVMEMLKKKDIVNKAYEKTINACKSALKKAGKSTPDDNYALMIEFKKQFIDTNLLGRDNYALIRKIYATKKAIDDGKLNEIPEDDIYSSNLHAKNLEIILGDASNGKKRTSKSKQEVAKAC